MTAVQPLAIRFGDRQLSVECPRHGRWVFPPDSEEVDGFAHDHAGCAAVPAQLRRRPVGPPLKSRRTPLVHLLPAPPPAATSSDTAGYSAPGHLGVTLGFAPAHRRDWRSPGSVRL